MCVNEYGDYYDCDDDDYDGYNSGLGAVWIVVIVAACVLKVLFWSCVCYRIRRRYTQGHPYVVSHTSLVAVVSSPPPANARSTYYPADATTAPVYVAQPAVRPAPAPLAAMYDADPPVYCQHPDRELLLA